MIHTYRTFIILCLLFFGYTGYGQEVEFNKVSYITLYGKEYDTTGMISNIYQYSICTVNPNVWGEEWWSKGYHEFSINLDSSLIIYSDGENRIPLKRHGRMKYFINYLAGEEYLISTGLYTFEHLKDVYIIEFLDADHLMIYGHSGSSFDKQTRITIIYSKELIPMLDIKQWDDD